GVRERLSRATGVEAVDCRRLREALGRLFERFTSRGAKACAISLPPQFIPAPVSAEQLSQALTDFYRDQGDASSRAVVVQGVFWFLAELCREFRWPFDLMIGVNRKVYAHGVFQGQDLFDQRTSLVQYAELFNAFPDVIFPVSVLSSVQNQELVSFSWIFPNVVTNGHWWYSNIPTFIDRDARARLQAVPKTKQLGYYSDAYKLEFVLPKFNMYRAILAQILADDFVRSGRYSETQAVDLARLLLRENSCRIFHLS
ncbi:MAG: amidohydrolase, partial [Gemmataceae bacterium]|nr:amidohydrolase [Gemmataceae bacterium]